MTISLKEAYEIVRKSLPNYNVKVEVSYGTSHYDRDEKLRWEINVSEKDDREKSAYETDEIFAIALAKVLAEVQRKTAKPAPDVIVEGGEKSAEPDPQPSIKVSPETEIPF